MSTTQVSDVQQGFGGFKKNVGNGIAKAIFTARGGGLVNDSGFRGSAKEDGMMLGCKAIEP